MVFMVLKPCALPTFFLPIIQFFIFYYFLLFCYEETLQQLPYIVLFFSPTFFMADN